VNFEEGMKYIRLASCVAVGPAAALISLATHVLISRWQEVGPWEKFAGIVELVSGWDIVVIIALMTRMRNPRTAQYLSYAAFALLPFNMACSSVAHDASEHAVNVLVILGVVAIYQISAFRQLSSLIIDGNLVAGFGYPEIEL